MDEEDDAGEDHSMRRRTLPRTSGQGGAGVDRDGADVSLGLGFSLIWTLAADDLATAVLIDVVARRLMAAFLKMLLSARLAHCRRGQQDAVDTVRLQAPSI